MPFMHRHINIDTIKNNEINFIYMSDLHLEGDTDYLSNNNLTRYSPENTQADIVILAGDIHSGVKAKSYIDFLISKGFIVIYVLGNHEFWFNDYDDIIAQWRKIDEETPNLFFLEKDIVTINDVDFLGCCMWTPIGTKNLMDSIDFFVNQSISDSNDFNNIKGMTPSIMRHLYFDSIEFIKDNLNNDRKQVVVTHYAPSELSSLDCYKGKPTNQLFFSELGDLIAYSNIKVWVHGHMHNTSDYHIHNTRIVCNPSGYFNFQLHNQDFDAKRTISIQLN